MFTYEWNQIVKNEATGRLSPSGHPEVKVTIAVGDVGYGWTDNEAQLAAEDAWHSGSRDPFVVRNGVPRHVEYCGLTREEVLDRVPDANV